MRVGIALVALVLVGACGRGAFAQSTLPALGEIVKDLGSGDFGVREAAQGALGKVPVEQMEALKQAAAGTQDAEVKARLEGRVAEMQRTVLFHPGGIDLDVTKAPLAEVVKLINEQVKETKGPVDPSDYLKAAGTKTGSFTLHLKNASFVDVLRAMNEQYPLNIPSSSVHTAVIEVADPPESRPQWNYSVDGSVAVQTSVTRNTPAVRTNAGASAVWHISCKAYFDPRVHLALEQVNTHWSSVRDDQGNILIGAYPERATRNELVFNLRKQVMEIGEDMLIPARPGARIVTGKTVLHWAVAEDFKEAEIADLRKIQGAEEVRLGDKKLRAAINPNGPQGLVGLTLSVWAGDPPATSTLPGMVLALYDGESLFQTQPTRMRIEKYIKFSEKPMKLKIYYPAKVTPVEVPIEISDVPLP